MVKNLESALRLNESSVVLRFIACVVLSEVLFQNLEPKYKGEKE